MRESLQLNRSEIILLCFDNHRDTRCLQILEFFRNHRWVYLCTVRELCRGSLLERAGILPWNRTIGFIGARSEVARDFKRAVGTRLGLAGEALTLDRGDKIHKCIANWLAILENEFSMGRI